MAKNVGFSLMQACVRVAAATLNQTPLDWDGNRDRILRAIELAKKDEAQILCLPELCITGYGCEDTFLAPHVAQTALEVLSEILSVVEDVIVVAGLPFWAGPNCYNTVFVLAAKQVVGIVPKQFLARDGIHYEPRWFTPGRRGEQTKVQCFGQEVVFGDLLFCWENISFGFEICEDAWVEDRPAPYLCSRGARLILNPSASHFAFGKLEFRKRFISKAVSSWGLSYVYSNLVGNEAGRAIYDGGAVIAQPGDDLILGQRFSFDEVGICIADLEQKYLESPAPADAILIDLPKLRQPQAEAKCDLDNLKWLSCSDQKEEEFARAVSLALFDYLRKSRSKGFVVSASGGADSSAVMVLCYLMCRFGLGELGLERFKKRMSHIAEMQTVEDVKSLMSVILTSIYQSTRNSSATTRIAAQGVTEAVGASFVDLDVDDLVQAYVGKIENALGQKLSWDSDDLALQNIQARVRGPGAWLVANLKGALLLATSNRSEAAVGYATMDGDTCGGLSPIAGVDKVFILKWLKWCEKTGPAGVGPIPELSLVTQQSPTAELRPTELSQLDEVDLMPYVVLERLEYWAIRCRFSPSEVLRQAKAAFGETYGVKVTDWVKKFYRLWSQNQWKRERYAPTFHVDDANLDPKTWCRYPILSGGYERELKEFSV